MSNLSFSIIGARVEPYAIVPTLVFRLKIAETTAERIYAIALRCQIQIEPRRRHYSSDEETRLLELFGEPDRWGTTLQTLMWNYASLMVPSFENTTEIDVPVTCTYDFEVVAAKYLESLEQGEVPLLFLFSGTIFNRGLLGFSVEQVPWEKEAAYRLPVRLWRELMDRYFPGSAWIRLRRESFDALYRFKGRHALPTWDDAVEALLKNADTKEER
jgi:Family of unknown function (DUF6084)